MLDNKTEQKWPFTNEAKAESSRVISFLFYHLCECGRSGNLRPRHFFGSWRHCRNKISCGGSSHCHRSRFSAIINAHRLPARGKLQQTDPGSSSDLCLNQGACLPSRKYPMTDFRQRQALSTLTAPAAWGIAPRSLVQLRNPSRLRSHQNRYEIKTFGGKAYISIPPNSNSISNSPADCQSLFYPPTADFCILYNYNSVVLYSIPPWISAIYVLYYSQKGWYQCTGKSERFQTSGTENRRSFEGR